MIHMQTKKDNQKINIIVDISIIFLIYGLGASLEF